MSTKKLRASHTPDNYKQKNITDYFKNIVPVVNRKLFIDESTMSTKRIYKGKLMDNNSDDDFCDLTPSKVVLPFPLFSDAEEDIGPDNSKNKKMKVLKKRKESLSKLGGDLKSRQPIHSDVGTMMKLNIPSPGHSEQKSSTSATSTPSRRNAANISSVKDRFSLEKIPESTLEQIETSDNKERKVKKKRSQQKQLKSKSVEESSNQSFDKDTQTSTNTALREPQPSSCKQEVIPSPLCTPSKIDARFDGSHALKGEMITNENISDNIELSPKKTDECTTLGGEKPNAKETLETPTKKARLESTSTTTGGSVQGSPISRENLARNPNPSETKTFSFPTFSSPSPSKKTPTKNKIRSPKLSPTKSRTKTASKQIRKKVTFGSDTLNQDGKEEKLNLTQLELLKILLQDTLENKDKRELLTESDIEVIEEFLRMDINHQYFVIKLFIYLPKWYNVIKFCNNIKLDQKLSPKEIMEMYEYLKSGRFVDTDFTQLSIDELLDLLMLGDLKQIATDLKIPKKNHGNKEKLIDYLKRNSKTQSTLTMKKSSEDVLRDIARKHLGYCIKLKADTKSSLHKVFVLQTYSNLSYCIDIQNFFKELGYDKVVYPNYMVENYTPFKNKEQFLRFYDAVGMIKDINHAFDNKSYTTGKSICDEVFKMLQSVGDDGKWKRHLPDYLHKFSAEYLYISVLKSGIVKLTAKYFQDVKCWLEYLMKNYPTNHAIGFWYKQLAHINLQYYKKYEHAAEIVIEAFEFNKKHNVFNLLQIYEMNKIANKIRTTKTYKVCALYCDRLAALSEVPVDTSKFVEKFIKGCTDRSGTPGKRIYSYRDSNNEVTYGSVENIALRYYSDEEEFEGIHCEGKLIVILFTLLFWDIIYEYYVPRTFISKLQSAPLDMYSVCFYENRKGEIDSRLEEIASIWSEKKLENIIEDNWNNHLNEKSIADFEGLNKDLEEVLIILRCIDRKVLSKIFRRLVSNYKRFRSGLPDLFLWNTRLSKTKFVEVKGENDSLQPNQILWIQYLTEVGAEVEVCHVSGVGAKKITTEDDN